MATINVMRSDRYPPTPSARLIKDIYFDRDEMGVLTRVWAHPRDGINFIQMGASFGVFETNHLDFAYPVDERFRWNPELGAVLTDAQLALRRIERDPQMRSTREHHAAWMRVQREQAEASGMY